MSDHGYPVDIVDHRQEEEQPVNPTPTLCHLVAPAHPADDYAWNGRGWRPAGNTPARGGAAALFTLSSQARRSSSPVNELGRAMSPFQKDRSASEIDYPEPNHGSLRHCSL